MRARITRHLPDNHPAFASAPTNAAQLEAFNQVEMTRTLRQELEAMGFDVISFDASRRLNSVDGVKRYQFDLVIPGSAEDFLSTWRAGFNGEIHSEEEAVDDGQTFEDEDTAPESAIAAVGHIVS